MSPAARVQFLFDCYFAALLRFSEFELCIVGLRHGCCCWRTLRCQRQEELFSTCVFVLASALLLEFDSLCPTGSEYGGLNQEQTAMTLTSLSRVCFTKASALGLGPAALSLTGNSISSRSYPTRNAQPLQNRLLSFRQRSTSLETAYEVQYSNAKSRLLDIADFIALTHNEPMNSKASHDSEGCPWWQGWWQAAKEGQYLPHKPYH